MRRIYGEKWTPVVTRLNQNKRNSKSKPQRAKRRSPARYALRHPAEKQSKKRTRQGPTKTTTNISPGRLSSWKDNCILQIHQIKAMATSVTTTKCMQKRTEKDRYIIHQLSPCKKENNKNTKPTKTNGNTQKTFFPSNAFMASARSSNTFNCMLCENLTSVVR